jgi:hypothetical protein
MKNSFAQLVTFVNRIDRRQIQFVYFLVVLAGAIIMRAPSDGGTGPI